MPPIARKISTHFKKLVTQYPVVTLVGPRQSGKTTLVKHLFPDKTYVCLENIDARNYAKADPQAFLNEFQIIDEVQHVPDLCSYIQTRVDEKDLAGQYILTGSQNFRLMEKVSQSLAGRTAILELLPFSYEEIKAKETFNHPKEILYKGCYPRLYKTEIDPYQFYRDYVGTYVERDIRHLHNLFALDAFQTFLQVCAIHIGQVLNLTLLASESGITQATAKNWLYLLRTSYIVFTLKPHFKNFKKRTVKQPKLYFYDTGLASFLLGIKSAAELWTHHVRSTLFENFIATELIKNRWNNGMNDDLYYWRDHQGHEIDLLLAEGEKFIPIVVKAGQTVAEDFFHPIKYYQQLSGTNQGIVVYAGDTIQKRSDAEVMPWNTCAKII